VQNFWKDHYDLVDLPMWRKTLLACVIGLFCFSGGKLFNTETEIYTSAPSVPVVSTRQVYPVQVNHGYVRYLTQKEADDLDFWRRVTPAIVGPSLAGAGLLILTYRNRRSEKDRQ
jgi:hypothetical protein